MFAKPGRLSHKIIGILLTFFIVATAAIGLTLFISWQLEGVAAAINDAGSQRMRTYRIGHLMERGIEPHAVLARAGDSLTHEIELFDEVLHDLRFGDPERPLAAPRNKAVLQRLDEVDAAWRQTIRPLVGAYQGANAADVRDRIALLDRFAQELEPFVGRINELVLAMERSYTHDTNLLRSVQAALILLTLIGTAILVQFFMQLVIRPVGILHAGMQRMTGNDLTVRLPVTSRDEFGELATGFNRMADHLQNVQGSLAQRVEEETRRLAERNRELGILYEVTRYLGEPALIQTLCQGFLERIVRAIGADAGKVALDVPHVEKREAVAQFGSEPKAGATSEAGNCRHIWQFSIFHDRQPLGVYDLYFETPRELSDAERHLLATLGRHLGVAIENLRLKSRETELAVSEERNLLAQDLHDSIAQGLAFMNIQVQLLQDSLKKGRVDEAAQTAGQLREGVQESYDHVRELLVHFRTRLGQADLDSAIEAALEKFQGQTGIKTHFERLGGGVFLAPTDEIQIMHIIQEALSNIRKHAGATSVSVLLDRDEMRTYVVVEDNGGGFDPVNDPKVSSDRHVGLKIMRERAYRIGGECRIVSAPGQGTRVELTLPGSV